MNCIDVTGYSFSGKSAVSDFLREFDALFSFDKEFEFELFRAPGGLDSLYHWLIDDWSLISSNAAIKDFRNTIYVLSGDQKFVSRLFSSGFSYDYYFPGFKNSSHKYINSINGFHYHSYWPFSLFRQSRLSRFFKKYTTKIHFSSNTSLVEISKPSKDEFIFATNLYLNSLFSSVLNNKQSTMVFNNAFGIGRDKFAFKCFPNARQVIVDRDPRDIYYSAKFSGVVGNVDVGRAVIGDSVEDFVRRFKFVRDVEIDTNTSLLVYFEDLVCDYEKTTDSIMSFLSLSALDHSYKFSFFDPRKSVRGVKVGSNLEAYEFDYISTHLSKYLRY